MRRRLILFCCMTVLLMATDQSWVQCQSMCVSFLYVFWAKVSLCSHLTTLRHFLNFVLLFYFRPLAQSLRLNIVLSIIIIIIINSCRVLSGRCSHLFGGSDIKVRGFGGWRDFLGWGWHRVRRGKCRTGGRYARQRHWQQVDRCRRLTFAFVVTFHPDMSFAYPFRRAWLSGPSIRHFKPFFLEPWIPL